MNAELLNILGSATPLTASQAGEVVYTVTDDQTARCMHALRGLVRQVPSFLLVRGTRTLASRILGLSFSCSDSQKSFASSGDNDIALVYFLKTVVVGDGTTAAFHRNMAQRYTPTINQIAPWIYEAPVMPRGETSVRPLGVMF